MRVYGHYVNFVCSAEAHKLNLDKVVSERNEHLAGFLQQGDYLAGYQPPPRETVRGELPRWVDGT